MTKEIIEELVELEIFNEQDILNDNELSTYLQIQQLKMIKSMKAMIAFFVVLTVIGMVLTLISILNML